MNRHPLSAAFPSFSEDDLAALVEDIRQFGQRESGLVFEGMVLDGWNRYQACVRLGIEFNYIEFEEEYPGIDPEDYVVSKNLHRRHMTDSQRAASVIAVSRWVPVGRPNNLAHRATLSTNAELAHRADVSERTISRAKVAHEAGLGPAVIAGEMTLRQAESAAKAQRAPTIREQNRAAATERREILDESAPTANKPSSRVDAGEDSSGEPNAWADLTPPTARTSSALEIVTVERLQDEIRELKDELDTQYSLVRDLSAEISVLEKAASPDVAEQIRRLDEMLNTVTIQRDDWMDKHNDLLLRNKKLNERLGRANG
ncbi:hypothetical protein [Paraburkholderia xenovorans]|uniref:hypothetical protein n=1 Tax=Paraburkholderia xenovorans TaxID=36873 RepID=UPI0015C54B16|nr:hypothetical protein [Paraburkholderia xenovorans]NPT36232.1 hypothetical protein [Paraburkholderia xenovorans]